MRTWAVGALAAASLAGGAPRLLAQDARAGDVREELRAIRASLDELVRVLRALEQQSARRDAVDALLHRIDAAEKGLAPLREEARELRQRRQGAEDGLDRVRKSFAGLDEMQKVDTTGSASEAFEAERARLRGEAQQHDGAVAELAQRLSALDQELAERRHAIEELSLLLDRLLRADEGTQGGTNAK